MEPVPAVTVDQLPDPLPEELTVLDVREPIEWDQAHVPGSLHIPMAELPTRLGELPADRRLLVVCAVGARSARAAGWLVRQGHDAINLDGGLVEWQSAGRPLVSGATSA
jgi:rhodanese-related sulfurtransferase